MTDSTISLNALHRDPQDLVALGGNRISMEYTKRPTQVADFFDTPEAFRRLDTLASWIGLINENGIYLEELEGSDD